jgi:hypothetical protein
MSYSYLFKYIIIGDTGACFPLGKYKFKHVVLDDHNCNMTMVAESRENKTAEHGSDDNGAVIPAIMMAL